MLYKSVSFWLCSIVVFWPYWFVDGDLVVHMYYVVNDKRMSRHIHIFYTIRHFGSFVFKLCFIFMINFVQIFFTDIPVQSYTWVCSVYYSYAFIARNSIIVIHLLYVHRYMWNLWLRIRSISFLLIEPKVLTSITSYFSTHRSM